MSKKGRVNRTGAYPRCLVSEWCAPSNRNHGQHHAGVGGRLRWNLQAPSEYALYWDRIVEFSQTPEFRNKFLWIEPKMHRPRSRLPIFFAAETESNV
jgi:hypothetical protein